MKTVIMLAISAVVILAGASLFKGSAYACALCPMMSRMEKPVGLIAIDEKALPEAGSKASRLYRDTCTYCHDLPDPRSHDPWQWVFVVDRMEDRIKAMGRMMRKGMMGRGMRGILWDEDIKADILGYLKRHAFQGMVPESLPDIPTKGAKIFKERCAECHTLPDPSMHVPKVWEYVVGKMQQFQKMMDIPVMSEEEVEEVLEYLRAIRLN